MFAKSENLIVLAGHAPCQCSAQSRLRCIHRNRYPDSSSHVIAKGNADSGQTLAQLTTKETQVAATWILGRHRNGV
jgi:hypothetical protein